MTRVIFQMANWAVREGCLHILAFGKRAAAREIGGQNRAWGGPAELSGLALAISFLLAKHIRCNGFVDAMYRISLAKLFGNVTVYAIHGYSFPGTAPSVRVRIS